RQDLYFRLSGAMLWLPPLRERKRELQILAQSFLDEACVKGGRAAMTLSSGAMEALVAHAWPGNIRELKNVMEYIAAAHPEVMVAAAHAAERLGVPTGRDLTPFVPMAAPAASPRAPRSDPPGMGMTPTPTPVPPPGPGESGRLRPMDEELRQLERSRMAAAL